MQGRGNGARERRIERGTNKRVPAIGTVVPVAVSAIALVLAVGAAKDVGHALSHPLVRAWLTAAFSCLRTAVMFAFAAFTFNREAPARRARNPLAYGACVVAVGTVAAIHPPARSTPELLVLAGDTIGLAFYMWVLASVLTLRRCFGVLPEARGLVTHGPYRYMRHPVYLGELGSCAGLVIAAPTIYNLCLLAGFVAAQWVRMGFEEKALAAAFPEYRRYASETPRLRPVIVRRRRRASGALSSV